MDQRVAGTLEFLPGQHHAGGDRVGDGVSDVFLAGSGAGDGTGAIIGVGAGSDDGGIADSAPAFVGHTAGRCSRRQVSTAIEHRHSDRSLLALGFLEPLLLASVGREE